MPNKPEPEDMINMHRRFSSGCTSCLPLLFFCLNFYFLCVKESVHVCISFLFSKFHFDAFFTVDVKQQKQTICLAEFFCIKNKTKQKTKKGGDWEIPMKYLMTIDFYFWGDVGGVNNKWPWFTLRQTEACGYPNSLKCVSLLYSWTYIPPPKDYYHLLL